MKPLLLIDGGAAVHQTAMVRLESVFEIHMLDEAEVRLREVAEGLWVGLARYVDEALFGSLPRLRFVATPATGLTHIDVEAASRRGVEIISFRHQTAALSDIRATAEHTIALLFALMRNLPASFDSVREGRWERSHFIGREIAGKRAGLIGYGRLGRMTAGYLRAFGAEVVAFDPHIQDSNATLVSLSELLATSEIISVHASLNDSNHEMLGESEFGAMTMRPFFINTARGELVDERALVSALDQGRIAGAALDVIAREHQQRPPDDPLLRYAREHGNLIITPHIGGLTIESREKTDLILAEMLAGAASERQPA